MHTHIFPPDVREHRDTYLARDLTFREMYGMADSRMATAEELLASMDEAGVDVSVACSFAWSDASLCARHNDYVLKEAAESGGRIVPFCAVQPLDPGAPDEISRCAEAGARGLGELRPESQGYLLGGAEGDVLAEGARRHGLVLLFHVSEPVGHLYPGKSGLPVLDLVAFIGAHQDIPVIGAHWGGGLPCYALLRETGNAFERAFVDTAGTPFLYRPEVYSVGPVLIGPGNVLFGSDYPLVSQQRALDAIRQALVADDVRSMIEGRNAEKLLGLTG
jgi:predicted TIM-barrel fold metal-dependent hydrolase